MNKASAYIVENGAVTGEMRQCAHCQFSWLYQPGSGAARGICLKCMGMVCGSPRCMSGCAPLRAIIEQGDLRYEMKQGVMVRL